jgi:hypothetical protein
LIASATRHRHVDVAVAKLAGNVGEARPEHEHRNAVAVVGDRVQEVQEHARVGVHRPRDVAQHDERRVQLARRGAHQGDHVAALAQRFTQRFSQVDSPAVALDVESSGLDHG